MREHSSILELPLSFCKGHKIRNKSYSGRKGFRNQGNEECGSGCPCEGVQVF